MRVGGLSRGGLDYTHPSDDVVTPLAQVRLLGRRTGPLGFRSGRFACGDALSAASAFRWSGGLFLYRSLLVSLLCYWLVDRADGLRFLRVVSFAGGCLLYSWKWTENNGVREWFAVVVKLLLARTLC